MPFQEQKFFFPTIILAVSSASKTSLLRSYHQILSKYKKKNNMDIFDLSVFKSPVK